METKDFNAIRLTTEVQVTQGKLIGTIKEGAFGSTYKAFLGIPYAASPLGQLRFKDPQPPPRWQGNRIATDDLCTMSAQLCPETMKNVIGSEDCLYLNIYVPYEEYPKTRFKGVMVWIHGGDFCYGSGDYSEIRPDYFMKKNIILITVNYRLGVLGFLNLGHAEASGNQGLKDQVAALKWIKENISNFGGDSENITVFGNGAGAISAHLLMLSPLSKGLVNKAILQSGVALCNWAIKDSQSEGFSLAASMGCYSTDPEMILEFLQTLPYRVLIMAESNLISKEKRSIRKVIFGPTIDKQSPNPFLPCLVSELLDNGNNIPIMIGHNTDEILCSYSQIIDEKLSSFKDENLETFVELFAGPHNSHKVPKYTHQILQHYQHTVSYTWQPQLIRHCLSDLYYNLAIRSVVVNRAKSKRKANTYYYVFSYNGDEKKLRERPAGLSGVSHGDELAYMFYMPRYRNKNLFAMMRKDYDIIDMITDIWSNFAKTGDPNFSFHDAYSKWDPVKSDIDITCFEINRLPSGWLNERKHLILNDWF